MLENGFKKVIRNTCIFINISRVAMRRIDCYTTVPVVVRNSRILGVRRKGTGLFASNFPEVSSMSNLKYAILIRPES